ncbi:MAG TPA: PspC domain-containing protein [Ruminococcaceae bacterium]|nr:PspC domain-containing protein [Oscillospiraceae bacterium]
MEPKRLYKIEQGKKLCGVCGGVAEYLNMDPSVVRIIWAALSLAWGAGLIIYIIAALVLPYKTDLLP